MQLNMSATRITKLLDV